MRLCAVFDNLHALGRIDRHMEFAAKKNELVGHKPGENESQFEVRRVISKPYIALFTNTGK